MKLSIAWIFDHIDGNWKDVDIPSLVAKINVTTAEIEHYNYQELDLRLFSIAQVTDVKKTMTVFSLEWDKNYSLPLRPDVSEGDIFLITKNGCATYKDLLSEKEGMLPALQASEQELSGSWKNSFEAEDYILELDNKSITHRPDLWSHRGFAREIAAVLKLPLKSLTHFTEDHKVKQNESVSSSPHFSIHVAHQQAIKHFAGLYITNMAVMPSSLWMVSRLSKIEGRAINAVVDVTNYVMFDLGQPMHAFDADKIKTKKIEPRLARTGEKLELLDGQTVALTHQDIVISDGPHPLALAGIMGGSGTAINAQTESIFLESACFDPALIRKTSARLKKRTESSARFEKSVDPHLGVIAIKRFLALMHKIGSPMKVADDIISIGHMPPAVDITIRHEFIEKRIGIHIEPDTIKKLLEPLEFTVHERSMPTNSPGISHTKGIIYSVHVPTFRATKDVLLKEDILEEIARFYGYDNIKPVLPAMMLKPLDLSAHHRLTIIKNHCAHSLQMHEVYNYAFFDEAVLHKLNWQPEHPVTLKNPISEQRKALVSTLIPSLIHNVHHNEMKKDQLRFFEIGRTWLLDSSGQVPVKEGQALAAIVFDRKKELNFYDMKAELTTLFELLELPVEWVKAHDAASAWYDAYQTAYLVHEGITIGIAGKADRPFLKQLVDGDAWMVELNHDFLVSYKPHPKKLVPLIKYQSVHLDISMFVPLSTTVQQISELMVNADARITHVELVDFFEKKEWKGKRSVTFRYVIQDPEKTLEKDEIDAVSRRVSKSVQTIGAEVR